MTTIYLIRHAEAEGNLYRRAQGQYDAALTMLGRRQVAALAERFRHERLDGLYSSDLIRTQSTASAITKYHPALPLRLVPALREVDVGCWENRPWGQIKREQPEQYEAFSHDPARWSVPGGESLDGLTGRIEAALLSIGAAHRGGAVAAVSHAYAIRALVSRLTDVPFGQLPFGDNTAVTTLAAEDGALRLVRYADGSHLGELSTFARQGLANDHRGEKADGWYAPLALPAERELYVRAYRETWLASHGELSGFAPALYLRSAELHAKADPSCLVKILYGDETAGLIELDRERGRREGLGWISLIWVEQPLRCRRFGAQLLGHAVSYFRGLGRQAIGLHVSQTNAAAVAFYEALGFQKRGTAQGVGGPLYEMRLDVSQRVWRLP